MSKTQSKTLPSPTGRKTQPTLFDLSAELLELAQLLLELEGNPNAQDGAIRAALMDDESPLDELLVDHQTVKQKVLSKINNFCGLIRFLENFRDQRQAHAEMIRERARIDENHIQRLKAMLIWFMSEHQMNKLETLEYRVSHYEAQPPLRLLVEAKNLPAEYVEVETIYKPLTDKIKTDLKVGVSAVKKIATWGEASKVLRISKPKAES